MKNNLLKRIMFLFVCIGLTSLMSAQTVIQVAAGDNAIGDAFKDAFPGDIIELTTSGGVYTDSATLDITFDITIRAAEGLAAKPVIDGGSNDPVIDIIEGGLNVDGVKFINGAYVIAIHAADPVSSSDFSLRVNNCEFHNWTQRAIYNTDGTLTPVDSVLVSNSIFQDGVKQAFYLKRTNGGSNIFPGGYRYAKIENCLITGLTSTTDGHAAYIEPGNRDVGDQGYPELLIDHVTVDNCVFGLYAYCFPGALIQNCVVTNLTGTGYALGTEPGRFDGTPPNTFKNCIYSHGRIYSGNAWGTNVFENVDSVAAIFTDAAYGDYSLAPESPGKEAGTDGLDLGYLGPYLISTLPMIASPGFEEDTAFNAWTQDWDVSSINEDPAYVKSGTRSLKIGPTAGGRAQYVWGFTPGTEVSLLAWGILDQDRATDGNHVYIGMEAKDEFGIKLLEVDSRVDGVTLIDDADVWYRLCATMTIPETTAELLVYIWSSFETDPGPSIYTDDYEFKFGDSCAVDTKVKEIKYNSSVNVYPNPTEGRLYVSFGRDITGVTSIEIFDVTGKVVSRLNNINGRETVQLDLSSLAAGVYFGMVKAEGSTHSFKIIKKQ